MKVWVSFKGNGGKCHLIASSEIPVEIEVSNITVISEEKEYNRLNFDYHVNQLCKKAGEKLHALTRVSKYMTLHNTNPTCFYNVSVLMSSFNLGVL